MERKYSVKHTYCYNRSFLPYCHNLCNNSFFPYFHNLCNKIAVHTHSSLISFSSEPSKCLGRSYPHRYQHGCKLWLLYKVKHCECLQVAYLLSHNSPPPVSYIGLSNLSCKRCFLWLQAVGEVTNCTPKGSHDKWNGFARLIVENHDLRVLHG